MDIQSARLLYKQLNFVSDIKTFFAFIILNGEFLCVAVKYLKEITPYLRKSSSLADIGWTEHGASYTSSPPLSPNFLNSCKTLPLNMCYACQNLTMIDKDCCIIELHSPDGQCSCLLKCPDRVTASTWFNSIHMNVMARTQAVGMPEANRALAKLTSGRSVAHIGWLAQQVCLSPRLRTLKYRRIT